MTARPKKADFFYDEVAAERPIEFIEGALVHIDSGKPLLLEDFQKDIIRRAFGWYISEGRRKHRFIYVELPKGNAKSYLLSALTIYMSCADGRQHGENYCVAGDREQARIVFDTCKAMIEASPKLKNKFLIYKSSIIHKRSQSVIKVISAEAYSKHGYRPNCIAFDELHVQPNRELYDTLTKGLIKIQNSMCWMITTAGVKNTFAEEIHNYAQQIRDGIVENPYWLPVIYGAGEKDDPFNEKTWLETNPGLGTIIKLEDFRVIAEEAKSQPTALNSFKRLHLNIWTGSVESWIPPHVWAECNLGPINLDKLTEYPCWMGLDLASTRDLSSLALLFEVAENKRYELLVFTWCPADTIYDRTLKENHNYMTWAEHGHITAIEGNHQDQGVIKNKIVELCELLDVKAIGYDPWNADNLAAQLYTDYDINVKKITQNLSNLTAPSKRFETLIMSKQLNHAGNPVLAWMMDNTQIYRDPNDNYRPHKGKSKGKIDGIMASITAVATMMDYKAENQEFDAENAITWIN